MRSETPEARRYDDLWRSAYGDMQHEGPVHRHLRRLLRGLLAEVPYRGALEVGCGDGSNFSLLTEGREDVRLAGIDVSAEALARARASWPDVELHQLDIQAQSPDGSWDLVLCSLVLEHLPDDVAALRNIRAITGGRLLLATIGGDFERHRRWEEQVGHVRNYASGELERKLAVAGFEIERSIRWGFPLYSPLARRLQNRLPARAEFGLPLRAAARIAYWAYWLNSRRRGDLLLVRAAAAPGEGS
jgi:SAM-dependent methyltransferase